ncbi:phosphate ABC transporter permease subunit PstC [Stackebrandtia albiflava]|uniref:phosphate ABC transporter permease subunit PstC n=1 Tax=Stackebrandtia albiflava TaxID=406432 RepID=UPI001B85C574|nr:phosphate ABC transporter permease subunit PstC [Stackebrandtia albiflava]
MTQLDRAPASDVTTPGRGRTLDRVFGGASYGAGLLVLGVLALILLSTTWEALPAFQHSGFDFIFGQRWAPNNPDLPLFGTLTFLYGTAVSSLLALLIAVPVSIGIALFLTELAPRWLRVPAVTVIDLLAAVPSVVFGLVGILVIAPAALPLYQWIHDLVVNVPVLGSVFGPAVNGNTFATAGVILAVMVIPIITSISREVFDTVPVADKQAAYALGATRWEMIKGAVFPHSFAGLVGAAMLGLGRAMGETIAVTLVIGGSTQIAANLFASGNSMAAVIAQQWGEASGLHTSALIGIGVVLFAMTVLVNYSARVIVRRAEIRMKGATA